MASIFQFLPEPDLRTRNLFLVDSVYNVLTIVAVYLLIIYKIVPVLMKNRPAFELKGIIIAYNLLQVVTNVVLFILAVPYCPQTNIICGEIDTSDGPETMFLIYLIYYYFLLKLLDLVETVIFALRKKQNQVSLLHVYHHTAMTIGVWVALRYYPGGQLIYLGILNAFVHAFMYVYYLLAILDQTYKTNIWWKKYITLLQIAHQVVVLSTNLVTLCLDNCTFPRFPLLLLVSNGFVVIPMFINFYLKSYVFKKKSF